MTKSNIIGRKKKDEEENKKRSGEKCQKRHRIFLHFKKKSFEFEKIIFFFINILIQREGEVKMAVV